MKIEPYLSMDSKPNEKPLFTIRLSDKNSSFDIYDLTEEEIREIIKDIEDQLELYLEADSKVQSTKSDKRGSEHER